MQPSAAGSVDIENMVLHYRSVDPYKKVAASKAGFFQMALQYLDSKVARDPRRLLDVGCGFGYFLEKALASGWEPAGVDIVPEAVLSVRRRVPTAKVFLGDLRAANLSPGSMDAVTMWDVLCHVDDPASELHECHRILSPGGIVGIRVRNVQCQLWLCWWYYRLIRFLPKLRVKPMHVFHRYSFSRSAIEQLLKREGFVNISVCNSPLTVGDPYEHISFALAVRAGKFLAAVLSDLAYRLTRGRSVIGPSLLVWAQKQ